MTKSKSSEHFDVHATVVYQLGESLITDAVQALVELAKNSYDADATFCKLTIITDGAPPSQTSFPRSNGWIIVEDNGTGMSLADVRRGWLMISDSAKREFKRAGKTTGRGRTPLGDKGLGRLSAQRLGAQLELITHAKNSPQIKLAVNWALFAEYERLSDVPVTIETEDSSAPTGTTLIISNLKEMQAWQKEGVGELERRLSQLVSPYNEVREFQVLAAVDGKSLDLATVSQRVRNVAQVTYTLSFNEELFQVKGKAKVSYFRPQSEKDRRVFFDLIESDGGKSFAAYLKTLPGWSRFGVTTSEREGWFLEFSFSRAFDDYPEMEFIDGRLANPGHFYGEVDSFNLGRGADVGGFGTTTDLKKVVSLLSGVRVYRDGFGVRVGRDWLNLSQQWTGGPSWYGLKPENTIGYVAISAKENDCLQETTDREGFKETPFYINFYELLQSFVRFAAESQEFFRRSWNDYRRAAMKDEADVRQDTTPEAVTQEIAEALRRSASYRISLHNVADKLNRTVSAAQEKLATMSGEGSPQALASAAESVSELRDLIAQAATTIREVENYLDELRTVEKKALVVTEQVEFLRNQIDQVYETIGLGMTAEALTHELENIATQIMRRTQEAGKYARSQLHDQRVLNYVEHVKSSIAEFRRQLNFLAPSLKFVRDQREDIDITNFIKDLFEYYTKRFSDVAIGIEPRNKSRSAFHVNVNRGKLIQVFDNLLLNSEYWLKEDLRAHRISRGLITIEANKPFIFVSDNGRGVDPLLEDSIFEPFVSAKGKGKGRGLGLFIVRQLLEAEDCSIDLLDDRNSHDRRFKFRVDLTGVLRG